jgi:hypothetical protein
MNELNKIVEKFLDVRKNSILLAYWRVRPMNRNQKGVRSFQRDFQSIQTVGYPPAINGKGEKERERCYTDKEPADELIVR